MTNLEPLEQAGITKYTYTNNIEVNCQHEQNLSRFQWACHGTVKYDEQHSTKVFKSNAINNVQPKAFFILYIMLMNHDVKI